MRLLSMRSLPRRALSIHPPSLRPPSLRPLGMHLRSWSLRKRLACLAALPLLGLGGWMVLRDSALFSVDRVIVIGLSPHALPAVSGRLDAAARAQTTTDFSIDALRASVARYTLIADVRVQTLLPHGVRIVVRERHPIARLDVAHHLYALAADGSVITGLAHMGSLAIVRSTDHPRGGHTRDPFALLALRVLSDAPAALRHRTTTLTVTGGALTIELRRGPRLIFGNAALPHAKWDAAAAVLADPSSRGASYIDLRLPSRPAAQVADAHTASAAAAAAGSSVPTPTDAATVSTVLDPALIQPSSSTSG